MINRRTFLLIQVWVAIALSLVACNLSDIKPNVLKAPSNVPVTSVLLGGTQPRTVPVGQKLIISSAHRDPNGITDVQFFVDGVLVDAKAPPFSQSFFKVDFSWMPPSVKTYTINIVAHSINPQTVPATLTLTIQAVERGTLANPTPLNAAVQPTATPGGKIACLNASELAADVTIPDGSEIQPGTRFDKTWRVENTGTCDWGAGYIFDLVDGPALGASRQDVPHVKALSQHDFTLNLVAPTKSGTYRSMWQLFDPQGDPFGAQFFVDFVVPQTCQAPSIPLFSAQPTTIVAGQSSTLSWQVEGATSIAINPAAQMTAAASTLTVSPAKTTTYTLTASNGDCSTTAQVTVTVTPQTCQGLAINRFEADPLTIHRGEQSTLRWDVTGATSVAVAPGPQISASSNTMMVSPIATTNYTLTAQNAVCTLIRQATVTVVDTTTLVDFIASAPSATWQTEARLLGWGGSPVDFAGYVRWLDNVTLQNGNIVSRVLEIHPSGDSTIQGQFAVNVAGGVQPTDEIRLALGYLQGATISSEATYRVSFVPPGAAPIPLGALTLDPDGATTAATFSLQNVPAGQQGVFVLQVDRGSNPAADVAVWVSAQLVRP